MGEGIEKGESMLYLVIEEVLWKVKSQGEYREEEPPNPHCRVTRRGWVTTKRIGRRNPTY